MSLIYHLTWGYVTRNFRLLLRPNQMTEAQAYQTNVLTVLEMLSRLLSDH